MSKGKYVEIKCQNSEHDYNIKMICLNEFCKDIRLFCMKCVQNKFHHSHLESWIDMPQLYEQLSNQEQECLKLLDNISEQFESIIHSFEKLKEGIKLKYIVNKERLGRLNVQQLNVAVGEMIQFQEYKQQAQYSISSCLKTLQNDLTKFIVKLRIEDLNYCTQNENNNKESLNGNGKKQSILNEREMLESTIKMLNQTSVLNAENLSAFSMKSLTLKSLGQFAEAITWADKALNIDPNHIKSLYCKAKCLYMLDKYEESQEWVEKVLKYDPNHVNALRCKGGYVYVIFKEKAQFNKDNINMPQLGLTRPYKLNPKIVILSTQKHIAYIYLLNTMKQFSKLRKSQLKILVI
ncbi:unnamed protein product [Paramecium octaurelia]|uniref:Tetratricopeptide repeat protein n=1 Tax=Paramecium octaurelia TaxID=43137 RepID=A0A8S1XPD8_PAROT|nr:unnamed protein product [Paramecium octaurelia]